jgi:hypothetical protein
MENNEMTIITKAIQVDTTVMKPNSPVYFPSWGTTLKNVGVNALRLSAGGYGDFWQFNPVDFPSTWAQNLESLLELVDSNGFKCYWQGMGSEWSDNFGVDTNGCIGNVKNPSLVSGQSHAGQSGWVFDNFTDAAPANVYWRYDLTTAYEKANGYPTTKAHIDKLAGNNSLGHNFIADPRILCWVPVMEGSIGYGAGDPNYDWAIATMDYIHSKGGKTNCGEALLGPIGNWDMWFADWASLVYGHADYLETHDYPIQTFANGGRTVQAAYNAFYSELQRQMNGRGSFRPDQLILGEFGIWRGVGKGSDSGLDFSEQDISNYCAGALQAASDLGYTWTSPFVAFHEQVAYNSAPYEDFGVIATVVNCTVNTAYPPTYYAAGADMGGSNAIAAAYSGTPPPKINFAGKDWTIQDGDWNVT